ncbi:dicarboxylate/amino acid:cation symporter [Poseidonibacter ostreae]|jgi:proton glutamate symport protein|uniref:Cation:dicarboxylase symporter family transporter n=1 Tax=Poseidonibacter ostreae TaxID=2654171 RepID=A0A6L4WQG3_9BACT|nr:dicarboxylate/amino acid:cation symporter [Poseidonibacter ostreae]KAB7885855.1 cation:dicarboxylase symporter family transporter [Poseidonibacter ostreae]KAB7886994.1 cation:dicarboxylase symporter family transporter [Poseidonibacter ostreae]KAB7889325.1 cation:dicarboxylase symporter family transporter [Poseidonibacter ostreae]
MLNKLWIQVLIGMVLGVVVGLILSPSAFALVPEDIALAIAPWVALAGNIFLALIKMVVIPLVMSSIILGITSANNTETLKSLGIIIAPYFVFTTIVAVSVGIFIAFAIQPGNFVSSDIINSISSGVTIAKEVVPLQTISIPDMIVGLIPVNTAQSELDGNILAFVILAIFVGVALMNMDKEDAQPMKDLARSFQAFSMKVVEWAMKLAPYAVFGLLCSITIKIGFDAISSMSMYIITVLLGLFTLLCFYLCIAYFIGRVKPLDFLRDIREVQLMAFSTSSSAAVMPLSMKTAEDKLHIPTPISKFVIPLGATINMDGTAIYQVIAAIFLTQLFGIDLSLVEIVILALTTVGASIGAPSTPGVGIVILATILQGIGVPVEGIALILGVDRILDMCRTTINVTGDLTATLVMKRFTSFSQTSSLSES